MTTSSSLKALGKHLDDAYAHLPGDPPSDANEALERYTSLAIAILDASHDDCLDYYGIAPGLVHEYLETKIYIFQLENGNIPLVDSRQE